MNDDNGLHLVTHPEAFFHELVTEAMGSTRVRAYPETEYYLVNLLNQFMITENLYVRDGSGNLREEPLAFLLKQALDETEAASRQLMFRYVGDLSLYTAGFFQESLNRKLVDVEYYVEMGGSAYSQVAVAVNEKSGKKIYEELADNFSRFVEVLASVSEKTTPVQDERDLLRLYEAWQNTGSERARKLLKEAGILKQNKKS